MASKLLTVQEAADRLRVSETSVWRLLRSGDLPRVRVGGATRISEDDLTAYIKRHTDRGERGDSST